ncbi:MAG: hypothetical protein IJ576_03165, partial [Synergistaceae bacterium]|nr:hypothetical protein [Synergistaceae bacterium]
MTMIINSNLFAKGIAGLYNKTSNALQKSISKLSSGLRMSVTDFNDASGMEIAQQMTSKLKGFEKAMAGGQDGISLIQTAEGALTEVDSMLQRMRELANQAANDTLTGQDRMYIQAEIDQLREEIDRVGNTTRFNNKALLNGNAAALWSTIPKETQAIIKGGLKAVDQFGQKFKADGNFNIELLAAPPGEAEVQKTNVFQYHHEIGWYADVAEDKGIASASEQQLPDIDVEGGYNINVKAEYVLDSSQSDVNGSANLAYKSNESGGTLSVISSNRLTNLANNANIKFTVASSDSNSVTLKYSGYMIDKTGSVVGGEISGTATFSGTGNTIINFGSGSSAAMSAGDYSSFQTGDEFVYNFKARANAANGDAVIKVSGELENGEMGDYYYTVNPSSASDKTLELGMMYTDENGALQSGTVYLKTDDDFSSNDKTGRLATFQKGNAIELEKDYGPSWQSDYTSVVKSVEIENLENGAYNLKARTRGASSTEGEWIVLQAFDSSGNLKNSNIRISSTATEVKSNALGITLRDGNRGDVNASGILELTIGEANVNGAVTLSGARFMGVSRTDGAVLNGNVQVNGSNINSSTGVSIVGDGTNARLSIGGYNLGNLVGLRGNLNSAINNGNLAAGDKIYIKTQAPVDTNSATLVEVSGDGLLYTPTAAFSAAMLSSGTPPTLTVYPITQGTNLNELDWSNAGKITINLANALTTASGAANNIISTLNGKTLAEVSWGDDNTIKLQGMTSDVASKLTKLSQLSNFYDSDSGKFLIEDPQTIKITQGDGKTASITLYASDTLGDVAKKINNAIANDLGQAKYVDDDSNFAVFVDDSVDKSSESVAGTILIRSAVLGSDGTLRFAGSEEMIKALGLNTIQAASESVYEAKVTDAHSGAEIASLIVTGNKINGVLNENVDVKFDAMAGVTR